MRVAGAEERLTGGQQGASGDNLQASMVPVATAAKLRAAPAIGRTPAGPRRAIEPPRSEAARFRFLTRADDTWPMPIPAHTIRFDLDANMARYMCPKRNPTRRGSMFARASPTPVPLARTLSRVEQRPRKLVEGLVLPEHDQSVNGIPNALSSSHGQNLT